MHYLKKKILCLFMVSAIAIPFAAISEKSLVGATEQTPMVITIAGADSLTGSDAMLDYLTEKFNISFDIVRIDSTDASYAYRRLAASNSLPDIMLYDSEWDFNYFVTNNAVRALPSNMSGYPNLKAYLTYPYSRALQYKGRIWGIPRSLYSEEQDTAGYCVVMYKDIFDSLGMSKPTTLEQWFSLLSEVKLRYPELIPLTSFEPQAMFYLTHYYAPAANTWIWENGKYVPGFYTDAFYDSIDALRRFWNKGLLDPNFMNVGSGRPLGTDRFLMKQAAAMICETSPHEWMSSIVSLWNELYPNVSLNDQMEILFLPPGRDGRYAEAHTLNLSSIYFGANVDDEKMSRILSMLDWLCSEEGKTLRRYGLQGVDYTLDDMKTVQRTSHGLEGASLYGKYHSYAVLRTFPSLDTGFINKDSSLNPFVVRLIQSYQVWKASITVSKMYATSLTANTVLAAAGISFNPNITELRFRMLCAPDGRDVTYAKIMQELEEQGINKMINKVTLTLKETQ